VNSTQTFDAVATPVLNQGLVAGACRTAPPAPTAQGTGLPVGGRFDRTRLFVSGIAARTYALGIDGGTGADQVKATVVRMPAVADRGIPPRRTPSRC
jgi:hypothetical protein